MAHAHSDHAGHAPAAHDAHSAGGHHGHHIVPRRLLLAVLGILMFFTLATVGAAQFEQWIAHSFDIVIPQWVNVAVALSIAAVKSIIVAAIFMQLRYDSPVNTLVVVFTLMCFSFFLGFIMIDLGNRDAIYEYKGKLVQAGGTGGLKRASGTKTEIDPVTKESKEVTQYVAIDKPIVVFAREKADKTIDTILTEADKTGKPLARELLNKVLQTRLAIVAAEAEEKGEFEKLGAPQRKYLAQNPEVMGLAHSAHGGHAKITRSSAQASRPVDSVALPVSPKAAHGHADHADPASGKHDGKSEADKHDAPSKPAH